MKNQSSPRRHGDAEKKIRRRMFVIVDESKYGGIKARVMVVWHKGVPGQIVSWTDTCTGCTEYVEGQLAYGPGGCRECGYTGKRIRRAWVPLTDPARTEAFRKRKARA